MEQITGKAAPRSRTGMAEFRDHWPTLLGATLAASVGTIGLQAYTSGTFMPALMVETHFTRQQVSVGTLMLSATVAVTAPFAGQLIDQIGPRRMIAFAIVGEAIGFAMLGGIPAQFHCFAGAMVLLGILGVGSTPPSFSRLISARFDCARGLALGIMISGLGVTAITAPFWAIPILGIGGWRMGYRVLALLVLALGGAGLLVMRLDRTEPMVVPAARRDVGDWTALRQPLFWAILACFAAPGLFGGGYLLHLISILHEKGFSASDAAKVQALLGVAIIGGRLVSGAAMDRVFAPYVAAVAFGLAAIGCALLFSTHPAVLYIAALAVGLPIGAELDILAYVMSRYFGLPSFGRCYSLAYSSVIVSAGASPVLIAALAPNGDYSRALIISAIGLALSAIAVACLPRSTSREII